MDWHMAHCCAPIASLDKVAYAWTIIDGLTQIDATCPPSVPAAPAISRF
jgi:hypothetical protein